MDLQGGSENSRGEYIGGGKKNVGYCARIKKCASRDCWELGLSVSGRETLPNPDTHVFPLFEGTTLVGRGQGNVEEREHKV